MTYPQGPHQGGYPQPGPYGPPGGYPPPGYGTPRKSNTGLIVGIIAAVVVVLGTLGITGFVAPGFFLSDDEGSGGGDTTSAQGAAQAMVAAINAKDAAGVRGLRCSGADEDLEQVATGLGQIKSAALNGQVQESGATASVSLQVDVGSQVTTNGQLAKENGTWCWRAFDGEATDSPASNPPPDPSGGDVDMSGAETLLEDFVSDINNGDETAAADKLCFEYVRSAVADAIENNANLTVGPMEPGTEQNVPPRATARWEITGSLNGKALAMTEDSGASWCVSAFSVI